MMKTLARDETKAFLERFYHCDDGVVRSVQVIYPYGWFTRPAPEEGETKEVRLLLSVADAQASGDWCNLVIQVSGVTEFKIDDPHPGCHSVLSDGVKIGWLEDLVFIDFSHGDNDLASAESFRKVSRYVAGQTLRYSVEPHDR